MQANWLGFGFKLLQTVMQGNMEVMTFMVGWGWVRYPNVDESWPSSLHLYCCLRAEGLESSRFPCPRVAQRYRSA